MFRKAIIANSVRVANCSSKRCMSNFPAAALLPASEVAARVSCVFASMRSSTAGPAADAHLVADLGFDSMERKEVIAKLSAEFCLAIGEEEDNMLVVNDFIKYFASHPKAR